jgi:hypothetical protein
MAPRRAGRGVAGLSTQLWLAPPGQKPDKPPTSVSLSDQGLVQPLQGFMTNPAGAAVVNAIRPIRQLVRGEDKAPPAISSSRRARSGTSALRRKCRQNNRGAPKIE